MVRLVLDNSLLEKIVIPSVQLDKADEEQLLSLISTPQKIATIQEALNNSFLELGIIQMIVGYCGCVVEVSFVSPQQTAYASAVGFDAEVDVLGANLSCAATGIEEAFNKS